MGRVLQRAGGGLTAADKEKLVPENVREGVTLFEGTGKAVKGTAVVLEPSFFAVIGQVSTNTHQNPYPDSAFRKTIYYIQDDSFSIPQDGKASTPCTTTVTATKDLFGTRVLAESSAGTGSIRFGGTLGVDAGIHKGIRIPAGATITLYTHYDTNGYYVGAGSATIIFIPYDK